MCTLVGSMNQSFPIEYELMSTSTGVCIMCTFLDNSTTDCVAVVHQRISQLSSSGLMNIESSHKFSRFGDTAYGCIEGINLDQYQVGVVGVTVKQLPTMHIASESESTLIMICSILLLHSVCTVSKLANCRTSCIGKGTCS